MADPVLHTIAELYATRGRTQYDDEAVTQLEHALQAATLAQRDGAGDELVAAALLHDIGHLLSDDGRHEVAAGEFLRGAFGPGVVEPVRLHVAAKRYLCAVEPDYTDTLSPASVASLARQGGPMTWAECESFEADPHFGAAYSVRRWDDAAKVPGRVTPPFAHFLPVLERCRVTA